MRTQFAMVAGLLFALGGCLTSTVPALHPGAAPSVGDRPGFYVEPNRGQADPAVLFVGRAPGATILFEGDGLHFAAAKGVAEANVADHAPLAVGVLEMRWDRPAVAQAQDEGTAFSSYLRGDPSQWVQHVPHFHRLVYQDVWPGVDLVFHADAHGQLEYDIDAAPGADLGPVAFRFPGAQVHVTPNGQLEATRDGVGMTHGGLVTDQPGSAARYAQTGDTVTLQVTGRDTTRPLVIDPVVLSGSWTEGGLLGATRSNSIAVFGIPLLCICDNSGVAVTGVTFAADYAVSASPPSLTSNGEAFVSLSTDSGGGRWTLFFGGNGYSEGMGVDRVFGWTAVTGLTRASDFPVTTGASLTGVQDAFVAIIGDLTGTVYASRTYGAAAGTTEGSGVVIEPMGIAIAGITDSPSLPGMTGPLTTMPAGSYAFAATFDPAPVAPPTPPPPPLAPVVFASYLDAVDASPGSIWRLGLAFDPNAPSDLYVAGGTDTKSVGPAATTTTVGTPLGGNDAFVVEIDQVTSTFVAQDILGGTGDDVARGVAVDSTGVYVAGRTDSSAFPVTGSFPSTPPSGFDAWVAKLPIGLGVPTYSGLWGGTGYDEANGIAVANDDTCPEPSIVGTTTSDTTFPLVAALPSHGAPQTAFAARFDVGGTGALFSTLLGGSRTEDGRGVDMFTHYATVSEGTFVAGTTTSLDFPLTGGIGATVIPPGSSDGFASVLTLAGPCPHTAPVPVPPAQADCVADALVVDHLDVAGNRFHDVYAESTASAYMAPGPAPAPHAVPGPPAPATHADAHVQAVHYANGPFSVDMDNAYSRCDASAVASPSGPVTDAYGQAGASGLTIADGATSIHLDLAEFEMEAAGNGITVNGDYACKEVAAESAPVKAAVCERVSAAGNANLCTSLPPNPVCDVEQWLDPRARVNLGRVDAIPGAGPLQGWSGDLAYVQVSSAAGTTTLHIGHVETRATGSPGVATYHPNTGCFPVPALCS